MPDTKEGREKQARNAERRQREWEIKQARERTDETEPSRETGDLGAETREERAEGESRPTCHRRDCEEPAAFLVLERYQEETGKGAVEARARLCLEHTAEESPVNLDRAYEDYVFRVVPL